jgi:dihydroorotase (multifunctional complex type)
VNHSFVDYALTVITQDSVDQILLLAKAGAAGFKVFMGETTGYIRCPDDGVLLDALQVVAGTGLRAGAHAENDLILQHLKQKQIDQGRTDPHAHMESRPAFAEVEAVSRAICISEAAGCPFHIFHLSSLDGLRQVEYAQRRGVPVTAEALVAHLLLDESAYERCGNLIRLNPPIRSRDHQDALWGGLRSGAISVIATDHAPHTLPEKAAEDVWQAACGFIGVETALPLMLTEVNKGRISLQDYVLLSSENPARIWGLYPKKGAIQIGCDADLVLVDLQHQDVIRHSKLHSKNSVTPYDGWPVQGVPRATILRGQVIMREGEVIGTPIGQFISPTRAGAPSRPSGREEPIASRRTAR